MGAPSYSGFHRVEHGRREYCISKGLRSSQSVDIESPGMAGVRHNCFIKHSTSPLLEQIWLTQTYFPPKLILPEPDTLYIVID